ncbi:MAG TPA: DAK2 domain-containing protein [Streptosporangiaceae bacterium]
MDRSPSQLDHLGQQRGRASDLAAGIATELAQAKDQLNELDGYAGDGDLGLTVAAGSAAVLDRLPALQDAPPSELLRSIGRELSRRAPSTSGTLVAFALVAAARDCATTEPRYDTASLARILRVITTTIATRGKSAPGDKTILDALEPATAAAAESAAAESAAAESAAAESAAAESAAASSAAEQDTPLSAVESAAGGPPVSAVPQSGTPLSAAQLNVDAMNVTPRALQRLRGDIHGVTGRVPRAEESASVQGKLWAAAAQAVAAAADAGAAATAGMAPRHGRASWLAERSAGHEDAGARLAALALGALALTVREKEKTS